MKRLALLLGLLVSNAPLQAATWSVDPDASTITFTATFEGTPFGGNLGKITGTVVFEPAHPEAGHFDVNIDLRHADTGSQDLNDGMTLPAWFDLTRHPTAHFVSDTVTLTAPGNYATSGTLTLKGVSRRVTLPFTFEADGPTARIHGNTTLRRTDFKIGEGEWATGDAIGLDVKLEAAVTLRRGEP